MDELDARLHRIGQHHFRAKFRLRGRGRAVVDFETKQAKADPDGVPLFQVDLVAFGDGKAQIIKVKVPGEPEGLTVQAPVTVEGLTAQPWSMDGGRSGVSFRADAIRDGAPVGCARVAVVV